MYTETNTDTNAENKGTTTDAKTDEDDSPSLYLAATCSTIDMILHLLHFRITEHFSTPTKCIIGFHNVNHEDSKYEIQN